MPEPRKLRVFLCHASQDKPVVRKLYSRLLAEGWIDPWLDERKLLPGQDWRTNIEEAVESSEIVMICLSKNSVTKEGFIQKELRYAKEIALEKPEDTIFLIPILFEECEVPRGLRFLQWTRFFGRGREKNYRDLLESLRIRQKQIMLREAEELAAQRAKDEARIEEESASRQSKKIAEQVVKYFEIASLTKNFDWLRIKGRVDSSTAPKLNKELESIIGAGRYKILVDLTNVEYISSAGYRVLLAAQRACKRYNRGKVILGWPHDGIRDAMALNGFVELFEIVEDPYDVF